MPEEKKKCPMSFNSGLFPITCLKEKCAWWTTYMQGTEQEWSKCVIMALGRIYDLHAGGSHGRIS